MKFISLVLIVINFSASAMACNKEVLTLDLISYFKTSTENYKKSANIFTNFSNDIIANHKSFEAYIVNKTKMDSDSLSPLENSELTLVESVDGLYDSQEVLLEQMGEEPSNTNLSGRLVSCYPELSTSLIEKVRLHVSEVKLEESNISATFDTLYNYSTKTLNIVEKLNVWLEENKTGSVPSSGQFDEMLEFSNQSLSGAECAKDLMNLTHENMCQIAFLINIDVESCLKPLFPVVKSCN